MGGRRADPRSGHSCLRGERQAPVAYQTTTCMVREHRGPAAASHVAERLHPSGRTGEVCPTLTPRCGNRRGVGLRGHVFPTGTDYSGGERRQPLLSARHK